MLSTSIQNKRLSPKFHSDPTQILQIQIQVHYLARLQRRARLKVESKGNSERKMELYKFKILRRQLIVGRLKAYLFGALCMTLFTFSLYVFFNWFDYEFGIYYSILSLVCIAIIAIVDCLRIFVKITLTYKK